MTTMTNTTIAIGEKHWLDENTQTTEVRDVEIVVNIDWSQSDRLSNQLYRAGWLLTADDQNEDGQDDPLALPGWPYVHNEQEALFSAGGRRSTTETIRFSVESRFFDEDDGNPPANEGDDEIYAWVTMTPLEPERPASVRTQVAADSF